MTRESRAGRRTSAGKAAEVEALLEPTVEALGFRIVRVQLSGGRGQQRLQVMVERADGDAMDVEDCAEVSRACDAKLDVADLIAGAYTLEVSSPGIDRPLTRLADFDTWAGFDARVEMTEVHEGRRRFRGRLLGLDGDLVRIEAEGAVWTLPFSGIARAKLVLTEALIAAAQGDRQA